MESNFEEPVTCNSKKRVSTVTYLTWYENIDSVWIRIYSFSIEFLIYFNEVFSDIDNFFYHKKQTINVILMYFLVCIYFFFIKGKGICLVFFLNLCHTHNDYWLLVFGSLILFLFSTLKTHGGNEATVFLSS